MLSDAEEVPLGPVEDLLNRYAHYLRTERGLAPATAKGYLGVVRPFVASRRQGDQLDLLGLTTADVTRYALASCPGRATGSAKMIVGALRSLLRWLHVTGMVPVPLASAVPSVAGWKLTGLGPTLADRRRQRVPVVAPRTRSGDPARWRRLAREAGHVRRPPATLIPPTRAPTLAAALRDGLL